MLVSLTSCSEVTMQSKKTGIAVGCAICGLNLLDALFAWLLLVPLGMTAEVETNPLMVMGYQYMGNWIFAIKSAVGFALMYKCCFHWRKAHILVRVVTCILIPLFIFIVIGYLPFMLY